MSDKVIYGQNVKAIDEFRKAHFHTHVQVKVSYLFILSNDAIWMISFKAYAFNMPKKSDFRTQEVNKVGKFEHFMVKVFKFCYFVWSLE